MVPAFGTVFFRPFVFEAGNAQGVLTAAEGMLLLDCERARLELRRHDGRREHLDLAPDAGSYSCEGPPHNFVDLVLGKTAVNGSPGEAAMRSVVLLDAAYRSAVSGQAERV